jgi:hypothetical protein
MQNYKKYTLLFVTIHKTLFVSMFSKNFLIIFCFIFCAFQETKAQSTTLKVFVFLNTECPISQKITLSLNQTKEFFEEETIEWNAYFTDKRISKKKIQAFNETYHFTWNSRQDKRLKSARKLGASITPEVIVLDTKQQIIYQGAIDNWFYEWGKNRQQPTEFYLKNAIEKTLLRQEVFPKKTDAIGCFIEF